MKHSFSASAKGVDLRPLDISDIETLRVLRNLSKEYFITSSEISPLQQKLWYEDYLNKPDEYMFAIYKDIFIGANSLYAYDSRLGSYEFGRIVIDPKYKGKGYGTLATALACKVAFYDLNANSVTLKVLKNNIPAIKTYKRVGFKIVEHANNEDVDVLQMIIGPEEFEKMGAKCLSKY